MKGFYRALSRHVRSLSGPEDSSDGEAPTIRMCNVISVRTDFTSKERIVELDRQDENRAKVAIDGGAENEVKVSVDLDGRGPVNRPALRAGETRVRLQVLDGPDCATPRLTPPQSSSLRFITLPPRLTRR